MYQFSLYTMSILYVAAGINHFINPKFYLPIIPRWVPMHKLTVWVSGIFEILFGLLLLPTATRSFAAWGIVILLIAIFPANIQMAINYYRKKNRIFWLTLLRLPIQFLLIYWAFLFS